MYMMIHVWLHKVISSYWESIFAIMRQVIYNLDVCKMEIAYFGLKVYSIFVMFFRLLSCSNLLQRNSRTVHFAKDDEQIAIMYLNENNNLISYIWMWYLYEWIFRAHMNTLTFMCIGYWTYLYTVAI